MTGLSYDDLYLLSSEDSNFGKISQHVDMACLPLPSSSLFPFSSVVKYLSFLITKNTHTQTSHDPHHPNDPYHAALYPQLCL